MRTAPAVTTQPPPQQYTRAATPELPVTPPATSGPRAADPDPYDSVRPPASGRQGYA